MNSIIFKPIVPTYTMLIYTGIILIIILLNRKNIIIRSIITILLFIITQRPVIEDVNNMMYKNLDIIFVIDTTISMNTVDVNNNTRMNMAKETMVKLVEKFKGANYSIITFDNYSMIKTPFTNDNVLIYDIIDSLSVIDPNYAIGTNLDMPYDHIKLMLTSSKEKEDHQSILFFLSDGEYNVSGKKINDLDKYGEIKNLIDNGAILGYGSESGGKIKITNSINNSKTIDEEGYLLDKTSNTKKEAISKLNEQSLLYLKMKLSLDYFNIKNISSLDKKIKEIQKITKEEIGDASYLDKELYYYLAIIMLILLMYELYYYRRNEQ